MKYSECTNEPAQVNAASLGKYAVFGNLYRSVFFLIFLLLLEYCKRSSLQRAIYDESLSKSIIAYWKDKHTYKTEQRLVLLLYNISWDPLPTRIEAMEQKFAGLPLISEHRCMYKVHKQLREVNEKAYKPVLLAIGPYNDHKEVGQGFMEEHKLRYLQQMLKRTKGSVETYIEALKELENEARNYYVECIEKKSDDFVEMMLLDGCFIIELFRKYKERDEESNGSNSSTEYEASNPIISNQQSLEYSEQSPEYDPIFNMVWVLPRLARDLLLFENQLPYVVLLKLFEIMSEGNETRPRNGSRSSRLNDLALGFFSLYLPFKWDADASSYNSPTTIAHLFRLMQEALTPLLPELVWDRLEFGFRFKYAKFEHLLGLIHASISISILDAEIKRQGAGFKSKKAEIFSPIRKVEEVENTSKENSSSDESQSEEDSSQLVSELLEAGVEVDVVNKFKDKFDEIAKWVKIDFDIELQEAGIELKKAKKFNKRLRARDRNKNQESKWCESGTQGDGVESKTAEKFKRLLCLTKNCIDWLKGLKENVVLGGMVPKDWNSIPHGKELRDAGVKFNEAKKFKRIHALRKIEPWIIRGATELEEAGIKFKAAKEDDWPFSIKFNNGLMEISPISIQDHTEDYLRNLIAYEQYCDKDNGFNYVNDYVHFMDGLINTPKDVKLLRREGIIRNYLGDDEVISNMVNKLGDNINISTSNSIYTRTSMDVNRYCRTKMHEWMAMLRHNYLNSPWAWISILAAVVLLLLAIVQTVFSIIHS